MYTYTWLLLHPRSRNVESCAPVRVTGPGEIF